MLTAPATGAKVCFTGRVRADTGGRTAAVLFSIVATCERHRVNAFTYLRDVLTRIAGYPMKQLADLLPDRWSPAAPA